MRPILLGNGRLAITLDEAAGLRDIYFPHLGPHRHTEGLPSRFGVWAGGRFAWLEDPAVQRRQRYAPQALCAQLTASLPELGLTLLLEDAVHPNEDVFVRRVTVHSRIPGPREVRLFFHLDPSFGGTSVGDTVFYDPETGCLAAYKGRLSAWLGAFSERELGRGFSTGHKRWGYAEGTFRDAEDGHLEGNPVAHGSVDGVLALSLELLGGESTECAFFLVFGEDPRETQARARALSAPGTAARLLQETARQWRAFAALSFPYLRRARQALPGPLVDALDLSLMIVRAHFDRSGGAVASLDGELLGWSRDHYAYVWPRDAAFAAAALIEAGHAASVRPMFPFFARALTAQGYLLHRYQADGAPGSTWHPRLLGGQPVLPIQEDETALVLWAFERYVRKTADLDLLRELYPTLVRPAADFLASYRDEVLGLPRPSFDLWEERYGIFTFTACAVAAALRGAARLARLVGEAEGAERYLRAASAVRAGILGRLYDSSLGRFLRGLRPVGPEGWAPDATPDMSLWALWAFGLLSPGDGRLRATARALESALRVPRPGGVARYAGDGYFAQDPSLPGNPWILCTLWLADILAFAAHGPEELEEPLRLMVWAVEQALPTGVLPEQVGPAGQPLSVAPLAWSHAQLCLSAAHWLRRHQQLVARAPAAAGDYA